MSSTCNNSDNVKGSVVKVENDSSATIKQSTGAGAIRRVRNKQNKPVSASGRSHEENQERAYVAASRRSDRSMEARLESARRASEIHKKRCGRGLKVTEEAVMNEEMYEEEDPDYELRVNRLRMLMNYPAVGYHPYQWNAPQYRNNSFQDGGDDQPTSPGLNSYHLNQLSQPMVSPGPFIYSNPFATHHLQALNQDALSSISSGGHTYIGQIVAITPSLPNIQTPPLNSTPVAHFLPPAQFSPRVERIEPVVSLPHPKPEEPFQIEISEHEVVMDRAPLDLSHNFADLRGWDNSENFDMEEWIAQPTL